MEIAVLVLGCGGVLVGLLLGSLVVRAAVALANRVLGPAEPPDTFGQWDDWDSDEPAPKPRTGKERVIPEPGVATGMLVTFLSGFVNSCGYVSCALFAQEVFDNDGGPDEWVPFALLVFTTLPVGLVLLALLLKWLLPTTFGRAALAAFLHYLIVFVVVLVVGTGVYLALGALGL